MADIFHEVEEDLRRERLNKLWQRYGTLFVAIAVIAVLGTAAIVYWRQYEAQQRIDRAERFAAAEKLIDANDAAGAFAAFSAIAQEGGGYGQIAEFRRAWLMATGGDVQGALAVYDRIIASPEFDDRMKAIARIRAAISVADTEQPDQVKARVVPLMGDDSPWRFAARDIAAYADYRAGRASDAEAAYLALAADEKAPQTLRERAAALAAFLAGGAELTAPALPEAPAAPAPAPTDAPATPEPAPSATPAPTEAPKDK